MLMSVRADKKATAAAGPVTRSRSMKALTDEFIILIMIIKKARRADKKARRARKRRNKARRAEKDHRKAEEAVAEGQNTFRCPIGLGLMKDPVVAADGHTYERDKIEAWFASSEFSDLPVKSPKTNLLLEHTMLIPNHALQSVIQDAVDNKIASMRPRERSASPPDFIDNFLQRREWE